MTERTAMVFGAYGGVGQALARRLDHEGYRLIVAGRDADRLTELADQLGAETCLLYTSPSPRD